MRINLDNVIKKLNKLPKQKKNYGISRKIKKDIIKFLIDSKVILKKLYRNLDKEHNDLNNFIDVINVKPLKLSSKRLSKKLKSKSKKKTYNTGGAYSNDELTNLFNNLSLNNTTGGNNINNNDLLRKFKSLRINNRNNRNNNNNIFFNLDIDNLSPYQLGFAFINLYHFYVLLLLNISKWCRENITIQNFKTKRKLILESRIYKFLSYLIYFLKKTLVFIWWFLNLPIIRPITYAFTTSCIIYYYRWEILDLMWYYGEEPLIYFIKNVVTDAVREKVIEMAKETALKSASEAVQRVPQLALQAGTNAARAVTQQALEQVPQLALQAGTNAARAVTQQALEQVPQLALQAGSDAARAATQLALQQVPQIATETATQIALQTGQELSKETIKLATKVATEAAIEAAKIASQKAIEEAATEATRNKLISEASTMAIQAALAKFFPTGLAALGSATTLALGM